MSKELAILDNGLVNFQSSEVVEDIRKTICKDATDSEFKLFLMLCKSAGANPFTREAWFIKTNQGVQMMLGIKGFVAIANTHPQFDGMQTTTEEDENGRPIKSICRVYRKDRTHPSVGVARWDEYNKGYGNWNKMPFVMLEKCAKSVALREAFPNEINGAYSAEEMPEQYGSQNHGKTVDENEPIPVKSKEVAVDWDYSITTEEDGEGNKCSKFGQSLQHIAENDPCWLVKVYRNEKVMASLTEDDQAQIRLAFKTKNQQLVEAANAQVALKRREQENVVEAEETEGPPEILTDDQSALELADSIV